MPALLIVCLFSCSSKSGTGSSPSDTASADGLKLVLGVSPRQGFAPLRVTFRGELQGVNENSEEHYCLQEEWDFGDGSVSTEKPNCDPHSPDTKIKTEFFADHVYETQGTYTVRLVLGDEKVRSRQTTVVVIERDSEYRN